MAGLRGQPGRQQRVGQHVQKVKHQAGHHRQAASASKSAPSRASKAGRLVDRVIQAVVTTLRVGTRPIQRCAALAPNPSRSPMPSTKGSSTISDSLCSSGQGDKAPPFPISRLNISGMVTMPSRFSPRVMNSDHRALPPLSRVSTTQEDRVGGTTDTTSNPSASPGASPLKWYSSPPSSGDSSRLMTSANPKTRPKPASGLSSRTGVCRPLTRKITATSQGSGCHWASQTPGPGSSRASTMAAHRPPGSNQAMMPSLTGQTGAG